MLIFAPSYSTLTLYCIVLYCIVLHCIALHCIVWSTRPLLDSLFGLCWCVTTLSNSQNEGAPNFGWLRFSGKQNSSLTFRHTVHCVHCKTQTETKKLKFNLSSCDIIFLQLVIIMNLLLISWRERQNSLWRLLPVHPNQCSSVYEFREFVTPDEAKVMRSVRFVCQSVCLSICVQDHWDTKNKFRIQYYCFT